MTTLVDGATVIAVVEFIKRLAGRVGISVTGEVTIVLAVLVGAAIAFVQGNNVIQGALIGAASVGTHTVAATVASK